MSGLLEQVLKINLYVQPVQFFLIISTNLINIGVLGRRALHVWPCTHYFSAYAVFSIIYACWVCPIQLLRSFQIDWTNGKAGCKMHSYFVFLLPVQATLMLILASYDRYCSSSQAYQLRSISTVRRARMNIVVGTLLTAVYHIPMLIIYDWNEISGKCQRQPNTFSTIYVLSQMTIYYILAPSLGIVLGLLTVSRIRQQSARAIPSNLSRRNRPTEGQLTRMLLLQVTLHMVFGLPFGITYLLNTFVPSLRASDILAVRYALVMWLQCDYYVSFFLYILSGSIYRQQLVQILMEIHQKYTCTR